MVSVYILGMVVIQQVEAILIEEFNYFIQSIIWIGIGKYLSAGNKYDYYQNKRNWDFIRWIVAPVCIKTDQRLAGVSASFFYE